MTIVKGLLIASLVYNILISVFYFSKAKINNIENRIYKILLITNALGIILEFFCAVFAGRMTVVGDKVHESIETILVARLYLVELLVWISAFSAYIYAISFDKNNKFFGFIYKNKRFFIFLAILLFLTGFLLCWILPMYFYNDGTFAYTWGPSTNLVVGLFVFCILFSLLCLILNFKRNNYKKYLPLFLFVFEICLMLFVRVINPSVQLICTLLTINTVLMYFTIENPDVSMINELYKNKNIMEQTYEDKSNFLFELTQEVRDPIININNIYDNVKDSKHISDYKDSLEKIHTYSKKLDFIVNEILDVSNLDSSKLRFVDKKYNIETVYNELLLRVNSVIPENVKFSSSVSHNVPELYGDSIILKQILLSLLLNSIKHTSSGFIEFNIENIQKFDAVRLIISIKDSSSGIPIEKINEILSITGNLDANDIESLNKSEINLQLCQKVIKQLGGNMLIKSDVERGSEILLIIDQKINIDKERTALDNYESFIKNSKNIIVVNQNKKVKEYLKDKFKILGYSSTFLLNGEDLIDRIKLGRTYDYIIVGDEMKGINGITILKRLKEIKDFNIPVIIMIDPNKENLKKHFLDEGFDNYILASDFENDLEKVINKY